MTRGYLTPRELANLMFKQGGKCCVAGCESEGPFEAEHSTPNALKPGKPDQLMCVEHHRAKTKTDVRAIAKAKRLCGETSSQWSRREKNGSRIKGGGFKGWRKMNGEIVWVK